MKKVLSFIILMVCAVTGAWGQNATSSADQSTGVVTLNTNGDADLITVNANTEVNVGGGSLFGWQYGGANTFVINGSISATGLTNLDTYLSAKAETWHSNNKKLDLSQASLPNGEYSLLPTYTHISTCVLPPDTDIPSSRSSYLHTILSNASVGNTTYFYTTNAVTELPSDLVLDASKTYVLTGSGALEMKNKLMAQGVLEANIDMSGYVPEAVAAWDNNGNVVITTNGAANLNGISGSTTAPLNNNQINIWADGFAEKKVLSVNGELSQEGIGVIQSCLTTQNYGNHKLDLTNASISEGITALPQLDCSFNNNFHPYFASAVLPAGTAIDFTVPDGYDFVFSPATETSNTYLYIGKAYSSLNEALSAIGMTTESITATNKLDLKGSEAQALYDQLIAAGVSADNILYTPLGEFADADGCYMTKDETNKVFTVHTPIAGHFKALFDRKINYAEAYDGYTFVFDSESVVNEDDLLALVGDQTYQSNKYYVDLFNVPATKALCNWDDPDNPNEVGIITKVIKTIRERNRNITDANNCYQFKGLILPKDHTVYGSGTTLIQGVNRGSAGDIATCSEFIVYYKTLEEDGTTPVDNNLLVAHIYNAVSNGAVTNYQNAYDKMMTLMADHDEVARDADIYQISSNFQLQSSNGSYTKIDITKETTGIPSNKAIVETYNNEMVGASSVANMFSYPVTGGDFATSATATGMMNTPTEKLTIVGPLSEADYEAISNFETGKGPRVLDLRGVTTPITETLLNKINNGEIEYLVLPESAAKDVIFADYKKATNMAGLKAVINAASSHTSQPTIVANIYEAGSLYEARIHALDLAKGDGNMYHLYGNYGVQSVTLKGTLNAADIAAQVGNKPTTEGGAAVPVYMGADGHWSDVASANPANFGLGSEQGTLTYFDLEEAVFVPQSDMNFWKAGYEKLTTVKLPTSTQMDRIPANCMNNISTLTELHIPYNYKYIEDGAFWLTKINHITTEDAKGAIVDNGPLSYTLSANIKELGIRPDPIEKAIPVCVFPFNVGVTDIYALAMETPKCYKNVFPDNTCNGWGGYDSSVPYSRDRYFNGTNHNEAWGVLRFPSKESYIAATGSEDGYETMRQRYTDVNKKFSKKEQTGAVDANGDPILWPTHYEGYRVFNQASLGLTWNDWNETHEPTIDGHVNGGGENIKPGANGTYAYNGGDVTLQENGEGDYSFDDYAGWHQIVLSQATYVDPDEKIENEKIIREYEEAGWYTFCIPFNLSIKQVREWLGVPKSEGDIICKLNGNEVTTPIMPDIRQLYSVSRKKSSGTENNVVFLRMTKNLWDGSKAQYLEFNLDAAPANVIKYTDAHTSGTTTVDNDNCMIGGRPYIIKAYKRKGETISRQNIAKMLMTRYADEFKESASCVANGEYEQLGGGDLVTLRFAKPYENHKVQAMKDGEDAAYIEYTEDGKQKRYNYTMIGQFWSQPLPLYCLYMSKGKWYRNSKDKGYTWDPFKCVIMATPEIDDGHAKSGGFRDNTRSNYPNIQSGTTDLLDGVLKIGFADGRDDDDFATNGASRYVFSLDDDIIEYDEEGNEVTAIENLDGEYVAPVKANCKVYNMAGQYVGTSAENLSKGLYIVNGKKIVIQ